MLEMILDKQIFFVLMGIFTVLGLAGKWVANASLKRLVRAAGNRRKEANGKNACLILKVVNNVSYIGKSTYLGGTNCIMTWKEEKSIWSTY